MADVTAESPLEYRESPAKARYRALLNLMAGNTSVSFGKGARLRDVTGKQDGDLSGAKGRITPPLVVPRSHESAPYDVPLKAATESPISPLPENAVRAIKSLNGQSDTAGDTNATLQKAMADDAAQERQRYQEDIYRRFHPDPLAGMSRGRKPALTDNAVRAVEALSGGNQNPPPAAIDPTLVKDWMPSGDPRSSEYENRLRTLQDATGNMSRAYGRSGGNNPQIVSALDNAVNLGQTLQDLRGLRNLTPEKRQAAAARFPMSSLPSEMRASVGRADNILATGDLIRRQGGPLDYHQSTALSALDPKLGTRGNYAFNFPGTPVGGPMSVPDTAASVARGMGPQDVLAKLDQIAGRANPSNADAQVERAINMPANVNPVSQLRGAPGSMGDRYRALASAMNAGPVDSRGWAMKDVLPEPNPGMNFKDFLTKKYAKDGATNFEQAKSAALKAAAVARSKRQLAKSEQDPKFQQYLDQLDATQGERHQNRIDTAMGAASGMTPAEFSLQRTMTDKMGGDNGAPSMEGLSPAGMRLLGLNAHRLGDTATGNAYMQAANDADNAAAKTADSNLKQREMSVTERALVQREVERLQPLHPGATNEQLYREAERNVLPGGSKGAASAAKPTEGNIGLPSNQPEADLVAGNLTPAGMDILNKMANNTETTNWWPDTWTFGSWHPSVVLKKAIKSRYPQLKDEDIDRWLQAWNAGLENGGGK